jgi:serine/threonine-protein kinase
VAVVGSIVFTRGNERPQSSSTAAMPASSATGAQASPSQPVAPSAATPKEAAAAELPGPATAAANATVLVSLRSTPPGALVVVGGKEFGPTPIQLEWSGADATLGREVTFRFQRKGYRDLTVTRQIRGDRLDVEAPPMDPIPVRRPTREERPAGPAAGGKVPGGPTAPLKDYKAEPY